MLNRGAPPRAQRGRNLEREGLAHERRRDQIGITKLHCNSEEERNQVRVYDADHNVSPAPVTAHQVDEVDRRCLQEKHERAELPENYEQEGREHEDRPEKADHTGHSVASSRKKMPTTQRLYPEKRYRPLFTKIQGCVVAQAADLEAVQKGKQKVQKPSQGVARDCRGKKCQSRTAQHVQSEHRALEKLPGVNDGETEKAQGPIHQRQEHFLVDVEPTDRVQNIREFRAPVPNDVSESLAHSLGSKHLAVVRVVEAIFGLQGCNACQRRIWQLIQVAIVSEVFNPERDANADGDDRRNPDMHNGGHGPEPAHTKRRSCNKTGRAKTA
mmetsp:Transcript_29587/g.78301  ORF Transcript_29587/g.78301 Transcript_29587/m.78301 type:complete len:327 (-) Transcript_29587:2-982(-)